MSDSSWTAAPPGRHYRNKAFTEHGFTESGGVRNCQPELPMKVPAKRLRRRSRAAERFFELGKLLRRQIEAERRGPLMKEGRQHLN